MLARIICEISKVRVMLEADVVVYNMLHNLFYI